MQAPILPNPMTTKSASGILLLDKPAGITSFDCIRELKRAWKRTDLGHGGTLDRFATGLLPILCGEGLKLVRFFLESYPLLPTYWKTYAGAFELGTSTETGDPEGNVLETQPVGELSIERVQAAMRSFVEEPYEQTPPKYSAKKINGERASDLMREGKDVELKPVAVVLKRFECVGVSGNTVRFEVECSKGTYVRVLAMDLARKLGTVAHLRELRRTAVGDFLVAEAVPLEKARAQPEAETLRGLAIATSFLPAFALLGADLEQLKVGKTDGVAARLANSGLPPNVYCLRSPKGEPIALFELSSEKRAAFLRAFQL